MRDSRLFRMLQTIEKHEYREFEKWIQSPFFNLRSDVTILWQVLKPYLDNTQKLPVKTRIFQSIYGTGVAFDDHRLRMCMSFLVKCCEEYFVWTHLNKNDFKCELHLAAAFRERGLDKQFTQKQAEIDTLLEREPFRNAEYLENKYLIALEGLRATAIQKRMGDLPFQQLHDHFDQAFIAQKLRQACVAISHQAVYRTDYDLGFLPEALAYIQKKALTETPAISVYYYALRMLQGEPAGYTEFSQCLEKNLTFFPEVEQRELILHAINHCIKAYNSGDSAYLTEELAWYKRGLEGGMLLVNGVLSRFTYRNVVTLALVLLDFDWAESFIHNFMQHLEPAHRDANFSFNLARLEYKKGNLGKTLELLQQSDYEDTLLALAAKTVLLKVYFETAAYDALNSHLDAMQVFIRRHQELGYHGENYKQLIKYTKLLAALPSGNPPAKTKLKRDIEETKALAEKKWLLEQF